MHKNDSILVQKEECGDHLKITFNSMDKNNNFYSSKNISKFAIKCTVRCCLSEFRNEKHTTMLKTEYYKDLTKLNTFRMKVKARAFVEYDSVADLVELDLEGLPRPVLHIGGGSNLLFTDDFKGTVLHSRIDFIEPLTGNPENSDEEESSENILAQARSQGEQIEVSVGAGVVFDDFCKWSCDQGLWGVENLSGIPGEVGASAVQNIGAYGVEVKDVIRTVYCYDLQEEEFVHFDVSQCAYAYRDSVFKHPDFKGRFVVTHVVFRLSFQAAPRLGYGHLEQAVRDATAGAEITPKLVRNTVLKIRNEKLPDVASVGSAGSFFKNPVVERPVYERVVEVAASDFPGIDVPHYDLEGGMVKIPAAWLIERCGWKGRRMGGAAVWSKQPLVLVNFTGEAFPEEIIGLEKRIIASVEDKFGITLSPEVDHI